MIRFFDLLFSFLGLVILSPLLLCLYVAVRIESPGGGFYRQRRVGKGGKEFTLYKFRSMRVGSDAKGLLTVGGKDPRVTKTGAFIRKYKLD
ncbi:MAG: sugar transferase, partial [Bacteroidales bacterium]|nr:sugar transferase [Bacteroidales bacterium]